MPDKSEGIFTRIKNAILGTGTQLVGSGSFWSDGIRTYNFAPYAVDWGYAWNKAYEENEIVYQALRVYLKTVTMPPVLFSKVVNDKSYRKYKSFVKSTENSQHRITAGIEKRKALEELEQHPLIDLFDTPNTYQTGQEFFEALFGTLALAGSVVIYGIGPELGINKGKVKELHVLPADSVKPVYSNDYRNPIAYFEFNIDGQQKRLNNDQVCYIKNWNPNNNWEGFSPVTPGARTIKTDGWNREAQAANYKNGGSSYLISNGSETDEFRYTQEQAQMIDEKLQQKAKGFWNSGNKFSIAGKVDVNKLGDTIVDMNLLESAGYSRGVIAQLFGVDSILIGDAKNSKYNNGSEAYKALITKTAIPAQQHVMDKLGRWLFPAYETQGTKLHGAFDQTFYPELQDDLKLLMEVYGRPPLTQNQLLELYNYEHLDDDNLGNAILIQSGYETLQSVVAGVSPDTSQTDAQIEEVLKNAKY